ncbi:uncharacterized protein K02A2.6-like [Chrysoperla carnea]|uniref:uncharacterized protein K02A2.6-like n=1 Tax=Chrysoperla carnea TaxID=189513 RepID=UPI001D082388|nr:uncharacterized protein K02A2.6-like [Chrysoperla carnea]
MKGMFENKTWCAQMLLNSIGAANYNLISALISPKSPTESTYEELIEVFETHLCPKRNVLVSQHRFLSTYQSENQSIADYVALLRQDITECEFISPCKCKISIADIFLRAQFVRGLRDNTIREQILQADEITFDKIVKRAIALETSKLDSCELANQNSIPSTSSVNKISKPTQKHKSTRSRDSSTQSPNRAGASNNRPASSSRINARQLIKGQCYRCGRDNHKARDCRTDPNALQCTGCGKIGHVQKVCFKTLLNKRKSYSEDKSKTNHVETIHYTDKNSNDDCTDTEFGISQIIDVYRNTSDEQKYIVSVEIAGKIQKFEVDSGTAFTFLPHSKFDSLNTNAKIQQCDVTFRSYTGNIFKPIGKVSVDVEYQGTRSTEELFIVPDGFDTLLGRTWIRHLNIRLSDIDHGNCGSNSAVWQVIEQKVGCIPNLKVSLKLREKTVPCYFRQREVPYALRDKVEKELDNLEEQGIISKVQASDWGSPLVIIPKADQTVRLCVDYKLAVNKCLVNDNYPIRQVTEIFDSLRDSKYFCRLDLYKAYLHVQVDDESSYIQTITTHRGNYRMHRLSFGIKTAPSEFNRILDQILGGLPKTMSYFDDIIVHGATKEECKLNLNACLQRLRQFDLHLNKNKCSLFQEKIEYLGHVVEYNKITKSPEKVAAIREMPRPANNDDVRRFLGMVTYYSRFIPNNSTITYPLRKLLRKDVKFSWNTACEAAFIRLKDEIASDRTLTPFDPSKPTILSCDASPVGIAGVLSHVIDGHERPVAFASRSLTTAEQNYAQIDREALAIVFSTDHFFKYIYGRQFKLKMDNKALTRIFHENNKLPPITSGRLLRYAAYLTAFDYQVEYKKGSENTDADCLSRAPIQQTKITDDIRINREVLQACMVSVNEISTDTLNATTIKNETSKDETIQVIIREIQTDAEASIQYTFEEGILFKGQRVVIPKSLQKSTLRELHKTHVGITKMKQLARRFVYWKIIDKDIEKILRNCESCAEIKSNPAKVPLHPWEQPDENWERIHIDYAGEFQGHYFLIIIDAKSKWAEIKITKNSPTTASTIELLNDVFATHGFPKYIVSDNASIFVSEQFKQYCVEN